MIKFPSQKEYPKKIYIKSEIYTIVFTNKITDYGDCDSVKRRIRIRKGMSKRETFSTFVHEVLHAFAFEGGFRLRHKLLYKLERAIVELIWDNFT